LRFFFTTTGSAGHSGGAGQTQAGHAGGASAAGHTTGAGHSGAGAPHLFLAEASPAGKPASATINNPSWASFKNFMRISKNVE